MSITLYIGRHGTTRLNSEEKLRGWIDIKLNDEGLEEANDMAQAMAGVDLDRIYCSDLDRAEQTAKIVAEPHELKPVVRSWFRPLHYGDLEGKLLSVIKPELQRLNDIWKTNPDYEVPGGESFTEFQDRNLQGMHAILRSSEDKSTIMLVAHLRNTLLFHGIAVRGGPLKGEDVQLMDGKEWAQEPGSVSQFEYDPEMDVLMYQGMFFDPNPDKEKAMAS